MLLEGDRNTINLQGKLQTIRQLEEAIVGKESSQKEKCNRERLTILTHTPPPHNQA